MEDFKKLPQDLQTQENFDRLLELEQKKLELEKLRLQQGYAGNDFDKQKINYLRGLLEPSKQDTIRRGGRIVRMLLLVLCYIAREAVGHY